MDLQKLEWLKNASSKVIATTLDTKGLELCTKNIFELGLNTRIETKVEDLTAPYPYSKNYFDYIYARLVLHYLSYQDLDTVLQNFKNSLKATGHLFIVVRSEKNVDKNRENYEYDPVTHFTKVFYTDNTGKLLSESCRYFHTLESIRGHLEKAGFKIDYVKEYQEQLYKDFMRTQIAPHLDHVIEVYAVF